MENVDEDMEDMNDAMDNQDDTLKLLTSHVVSFVIINTVLSRK